MTFSGVMMQFLMPNKLSPPVLGILVEKGRHELLQRLIEDGNSRQKALGLVRSAEKMLETTNVQISDVRLGKCLGRRYSYLSVVNTPQIHHYALHIGSHFVSVIVTLMISGTLPPEIEQLISTLTVREEDR